MTPRLLLVRCICAGLLAFSAASVAAPAHAEPPSKRKPKPAEPKTPKKGKGAKASKAAATPAPPPRAPRVEEQPAPPVALKLDVRRATLANGLRVVVDVDHASPTVAIAVVYDVGSRDEERGRSGFAHLFEHMMFQGSRNVARGDHFKLVAGHGGDLNGTTNSDRTNYFEVLPENELALGLWLEADRMRTLDVSQSNFENQRKVVQEEYRMRVSNAAYQPSRLRREELVYQGYWPYEHSTIGSMADLDGAELPWVEAFHARWYGPNNAVLSIAGDVDPEQAIALARQYFEDVPRIADPRVVAKGADDASAAPAPKAPEGGLAEQTAQRSAHVKDDHARTPGLFFGWAIPPARSADHYALEIASDILGGGESSRLHQLLVRDRSLAQSIGASTQRRRGPDLFQIDAVLASGAKPADVEKAIEGELQALATRGPSDADLAKSRRRAEAAAVLDLQSNLARARRLGEYELYFGDARLLTEELPRYLAVTKDDVKRVAAKYLGPTRRTIVEAAPAEGAVAEKAAAPAKEKPEPHHAATAAAKPAKDAGAKGAAPKKGGAKTKKTKKP